jgi:hypothetical protein
MFYYRPPKSNCWGHKLFFKDPAKAKEAVNGFLHTYFEGMKEEWDTTRQLMMEMTWKSSALPNIDWPQDAPEIVLLLITGDRVMFMNMPIPVSIEVPESYDFLKKFAADAPIKLKAKHFHPVLPHGDKDKNAAKRAEILRRLKKAIEAK